LDKSSAQKGRKKNAHESKTDVHSTDNGEFLIGLYAIAKADEKPYV